MAGLSNHYDAIIAIKDIIDGLSLEGLTGGTVIQEVATSLDGQIPLPFVSISPYGPERVGDETDARDGAYYGALVAIIAKPSVTDLEQRLAWRQSIRRAMKNRSLDGLPQNYNLDVEPGNVVEPRAWFDRDAFVSGMVVRVFFQEPRA
ncbi:hypothetical protein [Schlesneria sp. T3-172]|uniref:hypothetical protein n=1 Tax=Schlesneria sphaerica TaxID=3373610 RepID=UPI0037CBA974